MLWEIDIYPATDQLDRAAQQVAEAAAELEIAPNLPVMSATGYLIQGDLNRQQAEQLARELFTDCITQKYVLGQVGDAALNPIPPFVPSPVLVHIVPRPGVMNPAAESAKAAIADFGFAVDALTTLRKFWLPELGSEKMARLVKVLANDLIEQVVLGPLQLDRLELGGEYKFQLVTVGVRNLDDAALVQLSRDRHLSLSLEEMCAIQAHFRALGRDPTDVELETFAQTWSEHCCHKTLMGGIAYKGPIDSCNDGNQPRNVQHFFENMLGETIFSATQEIRAAWRNCAQQDWCVSVFEDNAGIVRFDEHHNVAFKVETHNHPSALAPYAGAGTGIGGVIRDILGAGLGAKPVANTNVFCFAPPNTPPESLPPETMPPRRVMSEVTAGVRDYSNRMGIPTVNGAIYFDVRYAANPLVFCGCAGVLPSDKSFKTLQTGDLIVLVGGRTGRDGIHGATFSSASLTSESGSESGGAVQIGNAITQKTMLDVLLAARDRGLYSAITDCGAGGLSSAVGEMAKSTGALVWLDRVPLKYSGLNYCEIWISESQERMVLAVRPQHWAELEVLCRAEDVEAAVIGEFRPTGRLQLSYQDQQVANLPMEFLHAGRPEEVREAVYVVPEMRQLSTNSAAVGPASDMKIDGSAVLVKILGALNVCSRESIIRQYDHEVQGGSVIKPLVGVHHDGPSDAAVLRPIQGSSRGLVLACGMNPRYAEFDMYRMAASAIDEAVRNCVTVGADPQRIALVDNFCWGDCQRPEVLGSLVRAALACHDVAVALATPFISGKDSLNNELHFTDAAGAKCRHSVPPSLLISAMGQVDDVNCCVTMDLKRAGNVLYQVGSTHCELGGSHFALVNELSGGKAPQVDPPLAKSTFAAVHKAIHAGYVRACHDLSEGGLAVAAAEMAFAGGLGARLYLMEVPHKISPAEAAEVPGGLATALLFAESNGRFLVEVPEDTVGRFEETMGDVPHAAIGEVTQSAQLVVADVDPMAGRHVVEIDVSALKEAWQQTLRW